MVVECAAAAAGIEYNIASGKWHHSDEFGRQPGNEMPMVMTTWHTGESEDDVAEFALHCANFEGYDFERYLVLLAGADTSNRRRAGQRFEEVFGRN